MKPNKEQRSACCGAKKDNMINMVVNDGVGWYEGCSKCKKPFVPQGEEEMKEKICKGCKNGIREGCYNGCGKSPEVKEQTESGDWQIEFDEKFVRDDGLMDKYAYDEDGDPTPTAEVIKSFITSLLQKAKTENPQLQSIKEYGERKEIEARAEVIEEIVKEIEGMGKEPDWRKIKTNNQGSEIAIANKNSIYNEALDDIINLLKERYAKD